MSALQEIQVSKSAASEPFDLISWGLASEFGTAEPEPRVSGLVAGVPASFIEKYADLAVQHSRVEEIARDDWFAEVTGLPGAWGNGATREIARTELRASVLGWVALRLASGLVVPPIDGLDLNPVRSLEQAS